MLGPQWTVGRNWGRAHPPILLGAGSACPTERHPWLGSGLTPLPMTIMIALKHGTDPLPLPGALSLIFGLWL